MYVQGSDSYSAVVLYPGRHSATSFTNIIHHLLADDAEFIFLAPPSRPLYIQVYI